MLHRLAPEADAGIVTICSSCWAREQLLDLSRRIHAEPELGLAEKKASAWIADALEGGGMQVHRGTHDLKTAFDGASSATRRR